MGVHWGWRISKEKKVGVLFAVFMFLLYESNKTISAVLLEGKGNICVYFV